MKRFICCLCCLTIVLVLAIPAVALAQAPEQGAAKEEEKSSLGDKERAFVAAFVACAVGFVTAVSILGAAYAVAHVGSAAIGAASEKPEMLVRSLMFVALGEGLAILGLIIAFTLSGTLDKLVR